MKIIGRTQELATLEENYRKNAGFVVIYGRRRVGKTTLITEFIKNKPALYYLATEERETQNMQNFRQQLAAFTRKEYLQSAEINDWRALFTLFTEHNPAQKKILISTNSSTSLRSIRHFPPSFRKPGMKHSPNTTSWSSSAAHTSA